MDSLTALRSAIMGGKTDAIKLEGDSLVIEGVPYPAMADTAFKQASGAHRRYKLLSLWLQYEMRDKSVAEYFTQAKVSKLSVADLVLVPDKKVVIEYLSGTTTAPEHIDSSMISSGPVAGAEAAPVSSASATTATLAEDVMTVEAAMKREIPIKTRASVLDAPTKTNLRDFVFARFAEVAAAGAGKPSAGGSSSAASSSFHRSAGAGSAVASSSASGSTTGVGHKRPRSAADAAEALANFRGTPIIIVPAAATSLINLHNAAAFLQEGRFVSPADARAAAGHEAKPTKITIKRKDGRGGVQQYHVIDNVAILQRADWLKVVAVFAQGPEWQFKGWRWGRTDDRPDITPTEIFDRCVGFHLMYEGDVPHANVPKWNVKVLQIAKAKRYSDPGVVNKFWELVDKDIAVRKPYLLPKGAPGSAAAAGPGAGAGASR